MFRYIAYLCLLVVVTAESGLYNYASASIPVPHTHLTPPHPATAVHSVVPASVPIATYLPSQQTAPLKTEIHKEFYYFQAPEEQHTVSLSHQLIAALTRNVPKPIASQQQVISHHHSSKPVVHYISYKTPAEAQQILQQFIAGHEKDLGGQATASNVNNQHFTTNVNSQYVDSAFSHGNSHIHDVNPKLEAVSNVESVAGYLPPVASNIESNYIAPAASNVNRLYIQPAASEQESQYRAPAVSNGDGPYVVDLPSPTALNRNLLPPATSNVVSELQTPDASNVV